jgi:hypothetical protein
MDYPMCTELSRQTQKLCSLTYFLAWWVHFYAKSCFGIFHFLGTSNSDGCCIWKCGKAVIDCQVQKKRFGYCRQLALSAENSDWQMPKTFEYLREADPETWPTWASMGSGLSEHGEWHWASVDNAWRRKVFNQHTGRSCHAAQNHRS